MQQYLRDLKKRSHELVIDPVEDSNGFHHAITHADEVLQTLSVHLHYMSHAPSRKPGEYLLHPCAVAQNSYFE